MINQIPNLLGTRKSYKRLNDCPKQSVAFEKVFIPGVTRMTGLPCDEEVLHNMFEFISHLNKQPTFGIHICITVTKQFCT